MSIIFVCDGCGKQEPGIPAAAKPPSWFARQDEDGAQHACSRECIAIVAKKTGKTRVVAPI